MTKKTIKDYQEEVKRLTFNLKHAFVNHVGNPKLSINIDNVLFYTIEKE